MKGKGFLLSLATPETGKSVRPDSLFCSYTCRGNAINKMGAEESVRVSRKRVKLIIVFLMGGIPNPLPSVNE